MKYSSSMPNFSRLFIDSPSDTRADAGYNQRHHGDPFYVLVARGEQFLTKHVRVKFLLSPPKIWRFPPRPKRFEKRITTIDNSHAGLNNKQATGRRRGRGLSTTAQHKPGPTPPPALTEARSPGA